MKSIIIAGLLLGAAHGSAVSAGPYANIENNAAWTGSDYSSAVTEVHAGYEFDNGVYAQGGPAFVAIDGQETVSEYSGKVGVVRELSGNLNIYGEVGFLTEDKDFDYDELNIASKLGLTFRF